MRTAPARHVLHFEHLEERLPMSASLGSLDSIASGSLNAAKKKPVGYSYPVGMTPDRVRHAYGFDNVSFGGIVGDGTGQTIAIVDAYHNPNIVSDLAVFNRTFGLPDPPSFTVVNQYGGSKLPKKNRGWASEIALDVEWAHAIAPGASILLVEAKNASNFGMAIDYARHVPGVSVISVSAAGKEYKSEGAADPLFTTPFGHAGETFVFAAGDNGGVAEYPSASPNVLSVGGTSLHTWQDGTWSHEFAWPGGGGGLSLYEGAPSYQSGLGFATRATPDVSYNGDPQTGFAVFDSYGSGGWVQFGGTSAGTPQWAALLAIANQGRALAGKDSLANAQAVMYAMPSADFHDIQQGSNGNSADPGYDLATGLGSPIADRLIPDLVAYNGSTDFTVAAYVATSAKKHKHLAFGVEQAPVVSIAAGGEVGNAAAPSMRSLLSMSFVANVASAAGLKSSLLVTTMPTTGSAEANGSGVPAGSTAGVDFSGDDAVSRIAKKLARRTSTKLNVVEPSALLHAEFISDVDAYFASL